MQKINVPKPLIILVGPTAVGKTESSIKIAKAINAEIISADSRYFYRGMDIGTAKPTMAEMDGVPHHLVDVADPNEAWSLALFQQAAEKIIAELHTQEKVPMLVGGTGQYIHAVAEHWKMPKQAADEALRDVLNKIAADKGKKNLYDILAKLDPEAADVIDYRNLRRTVRALEVVFLTGKKFSSQRRVALSPYSRKMIGLKRDRASLYERIDQRIELMLADGLEAEVQRLLDAGIFRTLPSMSAIGYKEIAAYLEGEISRDEAIMLIKRNTRTYVRRQANWFKETDPKIKWFDAADLDVQALIDFILSDEGWLVPDIS